MQQRIFLYLDFDGPISYINYAGMLIYLNDKVMNKMEKEWESDVNNFCPVSISKLQSFISFLKWKHNYIVNIVVISTWRSGENCLELIRLLLNDCEIHGSTGSRWDLSNHEHNGDYQRWSEIMDYVNQYELHDCQGIVIDDGYYNIPSYPEKDHRIVQINPIAAYTGDGIRGDNDDTIFEGFSDADIKSHTEYVNRWNWTINEILGNHKIHGWESTLEPTIGNIYEHHQNLFP